MALGTTFARLKREAGIKRCIILDGNVGDVYLNKRNRIVDIKQYLMEMLQDLDYDDVLYWDRVDGLDGDVSRLQLVDEVEVEGDEYSFDDDDEEPAPSVSASSSRSSSGSSSGSGTGTGKGAKTGSGQFKEPAEIFNVVFKNLKKDNRRVAFVLNWADYLFSTGGMLGPDERELLVLLGKALKDRPVNYLPLSSQDVNESMVILVTGKLSYLPISLYQGNPEVSCLTLSRPDREERQNMVEKIESGFDVKLKPGESLVRSDKFGEYIDMLDDFTNREIIQMARLSQKEKKLPFEQLYLLFKYGEKDNPWEKLDYNAVKNIRKKLAQRVVGQDEAIDKVAKVVIKAYMGLSGVHKSSSRSAPKGVLFFVGPTGVGKTELSKALAEFLFGDEQACIRFDMSEYAQENSDQKLIGAPPGYVGYEEGGQLTNAVKEKPFSIILFDEIEKAAKPNPRILDIFLQILEDGRLTDSKGETVYFSESVIIFTSNLGSAEVSSAGSNEEVAEEFIKIVKDYFDNEIKRPELLGRIGYSNIVPFNFIRDREFCVKIAQSKLRPVKNAIYEKYHLDLEFGDELKFIDYILGGADSSKGGRDILNAINDKLLDDLALFLFDNRNDLSYLRGTKILVTTKKDGLDFKFVQNDD